MEKLLDDFAKIPQKQRLAGLVGVVVGLFALHFFLIYDDQSTRLVMRNNNARKLVADLAEKNAIAQDLSTYQTEVKRLEGELERAKALLPDESEVPALLAQISTLGGKTGLEISRFEPQKEEMKDFYAKLPFKLKVTGNYHELAQFIDNISRLERIVNVENINMREPKMVNKKFLVSSDFMVTTYRFVDRSALPKKGTP